jgi:ADP-heptose:LPS heptosyltransferase
LALVGRVLACLDRAGVPGLITAGPAEEAGFRQELAALAKRFGARLAADPGMEELVRLVAAAGFYIGPDSGVTHLAAALGRPTVAAFGPTDPRVWGPRGERVWITTFQGLVSLVESLLKTGELKG